MGRPTIKDLAVAAGLSVATVNRVISGSGKVRQQTMQLVLDTAEQIGFYGTGALRHRVTAARDKFQFGAIIQCPHEAFSAIVTHSLKTAAESFADAQIHLRIEHLGDLSPEQVSSSMYALGDEVDALAVLAAEHPLVTNAIDQLSTRGVPVVSLISALSAHSNVGYVGLDSWKVGRTAAWAFAKMCRLPGKLGILVGTHRYRCHDLYESGFRSYFREHANEFTLLEPVSTFESDSIARELTEGLLRTQPDLKGIYVSGGGIGGVLSALRANAQDGKIVAIGHDLMDTTRGGLLDGTLTMVISHPFQSIANETMSAMIRARKAGTEIGRYAAIVPFEIYTPENI
ncbi:LacI family DNA-binding transcriptional regulator [Burkholderia sp. Bp9142]|uniref:LacI family DNA-binding transcriptional regulator n=1 Tax=Burkholderia sp. Bp9142 TaxID=2184573 RepID=UPI000F5B2E05|nr:LacI family DNA-binding transcriptional regulator [Burkholderia sp. Bp9142]RQR27577.1 LacI family DNA-binding transcriptional regulator [Burkholderia sp. Bp9142]